MTPDCTIIVRSPAELIAVIPYVLGFHPAHSIVVIGLAGPLITFGARHDLPPPGDDDVDAFDDLAAVIVAQPARSVVLVGYGPPVDVTSTILRLSRALERAGVLICDSLRITDGRWWSYSCTDLRCCPAEGQPCPPPGNPIAAEAVFKGKVALPDRQALVAQVAAVTGEARMAMAAATARARAQLGARAVPAHAVAAPFWGDEPIVEVTGRRVSRAGRAAIRHAERRHRAGRCLSDDEVAGLSVLLTDDAVHDYALNRSDGQQWRIGLWTDVLRRVETAHVAAPACLLAYAAWQAGEGPLARVALDRAIAEGPPHSMVALLDRVLGAGISPDAVAALRPPTGAPARPRTARKGNHRPDGPAGGNGAAGGGAVGGSGVAGGGAVGGSGVADGSGAPGRTGGERLFGRSTRRRSS